jgi:predicted transposase YdaD
MTSASPPLPPPAPEPRQPHTYDRILKWMITRARDAFLALIAPGYTWRGERSPELPAITRQADLIWEVEGNDGRRRLLHIELQSDIDPEIGVRLADYVVQLYRRDRLPTWSVVVYLRPAAQVPASPFVIPWDERRNSLTHPYDVVRLWEIPPERVLDGPNYVLWPLASLMAGATETTTVAIAERLAAVPAPEQERSDLIGILLGLAGLRMERGPLVIALRRLPMLNDLLRDSSIAEMFIEEGELRGERRMARVALEGRFGALPEDMLAALGEAQEATLHEIVAHIATDSLEQARARLGLPEA